MKRVIYFYTRREQNQRSDPLSPETLYSIKIKERKQQRYQEKRKYTRTILSCPITHPFEIQVTHTTELPPTVDGRYSSSRFSVTSPRYNRASFQNGPP
ncbi:hypothetical protein T09_15315 [Trichinella sp. T9]|nr:hypothetical protein T09_15315 [Trichinella sp. T9]